MVVYFGVEDQGGGRGMLTAFLGDIESLPVIYEANFYMEDEEILAEG